jgi:outer membrane receptor protein involved in Fe transport
MSGRLPGLGAILALALATPSFAQRTTGAISGTVKDASGAVLPGVTVTVSGANIVGSQTAVTNEQGFYRILNLPPGEYQLGFTLIGFRGVTRKGLRIAVGGNVEENASLEISQLQEAVEVVGESPVVDTTSNEVGSNYDRTWVENAPLRRYTFFDLVKSAPGTLDGGDGSRRSMVYGSSYDENSFQLDGVDITENFFNESSAEPNPDAIEEIEILSLGAPAEFGNLTGAVYNIVTRQGTNEFHGDVNFFWQGDGTTGNNTQDLKDGDGNFVDATCATAADPDKRCPYYRDKFTDITVQLGGPIVKDKLWFFASFGAQRDNYGEVGVDPTVPQALVRAGVDRYLFKLNWQASAKHKFVATFHLDDKKTDNGLSYFETPTTAWTRNSDTPTPGLAYTGVLSDKAVLDVRFSGFYGSVSGGPTDPNQPRDLSRFYDFDTGTISGGHYYWYEVDPRRTTATAKVSYLADNFLGSSHDFKFGVQYSGAVARGLYGYNDFVYTYTYNGYRYGYGYDRQPFSYSGNSRNIALFLDDTVKVNDRLSLNLGVRYDYNKAFSAVQDEVDEFGNPTGIQFPKTDFYTWNTTSPRLGFNWKLTADGRTVLKAHWGRYHRSVATGEYANVIGPSIKPTFSGIFLFPADWDPAVKSKAGGWDPASLEFFEGNSNLGVDPNYESPYTDQYIVSLERELVKGLGVQLNYVHKDGKKFAAWQDTTGQYVRVPFTDTLGDNPTGRSFDVFQLVSDPAERQFRISNPEGVETRINAVSLNLFKRMTGKWQMTASANWLRGTGRVTESVSGVGIQQRGGLQFRDFGKNPNDFVNTDGRLRLDVTWNFKLQFAYQLPAGFLVSTNLIHRDNAWLLRRGRVPASVTGIPEGTTILLQKRGENGRLPDITQMDARLQKEFKLGEKTRFSVFVDALNLLNESDYESVASSLVTSGVFNDPFLPVDPRRFMLGAKLRF